MKRYWHGRRIGEMALITPATIVYGLLSLIGIPITLIGMTSPGTSESNMRLLPGILALSVGGLFGLAALWRAVAARTVPTGRWVVAGLILGVGAACAFTMVRLASAGFSVGRLVAGEPLVLPLIAVIPVGVAQLIRVVRNRKTNREEVSQ